MSHGEIPLFPLRTVLFPEGPLRLRIFEPRYLDMISLCLKSGVDFGVVAIREGSEVGAVTTHSVGTTARIVDWSQERDGLLGLAVVGQRRFELETLARAEDGLYRGRVGYRADDAVELDAEHDWAAALVRAAFAELPAARETLEPRLDDAGWISWRLAEILPLGLEEKQTLLEIDGAAARLEKLRPAAESFVAERAS